MTKNITVTKKTPRVKQLGSRLSLSVFPFTESDPERKLVKYVRALLQQALVSQKRFNVVERDALDRLLEEQQLTQGAVFDRDTTIRLGRLMASETMLLGDVFTTDTSVEIITRLVDTDTSVILAEKDIYWEGDDRTVTREAMRGLALKYKQHFPLCEGTVVKVDGDQVTINLGLDSRLFEGIRLLAYSGADAERDTELLGIVSAKQVGSDFARCSTVELFGEKRLQLRTKVMVK
ncbi:MAG: hypothetical protein GY868_10280 [Deltaproteobacteria bacterium]|nr:hypothetical protein [Deltaproteobacteria bacterium]